MNVSEIIVALKNCNVIPRLTDGNLMLVGATEKLSADLIASVRVVKQELIAYLGKMQEQLAFEEIPVIAEKVYYPCSHAQQRMWLMSQLDGAGYIYNIAAGFYLEGEVCPDLLEKAFHITMNRHEILRTVFRVADGALSQEVKPTLPFAIAVEDISALPDARQHLRGIMASAFRHRFDIENGPLLKASLFRVSQKEYALILVIHHLVSDGWSVGVMLKEVMEHYQNTGAKHVTAPQALNIQYKDYSSWLTGKLSAGRRQAAEGFWEKQLPDTIPVLSLPYDFSRPPEFDFEGAVYRNYLPVDLFGKMQQFCRDRQVTLFDFLRSVVTLLLSRFANQEYVMLGVPVSGRIHPQLEDQIGLYTNTLPLGISIDPDQCFLDFLDQVREDTRVSFEYQDYPIDLVIDQRPANRTSNRNPLFDVILVLQREVAPGPASNNLPFTLKRLDTYLWGTEEAVTLPAAAKLDLSFNFDYDTERRFFLEIEYATKLFLPGTITRFYEALCTCIRQVLETPEMKIGRVSAINEKEQVILQEFNLPVYKVQEQHILDLIIPALSLHAGKQAIISGDKMLTYKQVGQYTAGISRRLQQQLSGGNPAVGLLIARSEWTIIHIMAILHSGAAYVPIDAGYPRERIAYLIKDAVIEYLVADRSLAAHIPADFTGKVLFTDELEKAGDQDDLALPAGDYREKNAYVIYTSGSTGKPKGVTLCHRNTIAFLNWAKKEFAATTFDVLYAATSFCFDLSIFEFFVPLMLGKPVRILSSALDITGHLVHDHNVFLNTVPAVVKSLQNNGTDWSRVSALNIAGELLTRQVVKGLDFGRIEVRNLYGPTEDTTYSTVYRITDDKEDRIPIGKPVGDTQLYILDAQQQPLPAGVTGEIYLSGQSTAPGYIHQPLLTAQRFLPNPFLKGFRMYRTGDAGRYLPDGNVVFSGRLDDQVKIRGYRVEPDEIRLVLEAHPLVEQCLVKTFDTPHSGPELAAYWLGSPVLSEDDLKSYLAALLPAYMIPAFWVRLSVMPLTPNGKIDIRQLPQPDMDKAGTAGRLPVSAMELELAAIWQEVLGREIVNVDQHFLEAGGNSLMIIRLRFLIESRLSKTVSLTELFTFTTIAAQAALLEQRATAETVLINPVTERDSYPISIAQERLWVLTGFSAASVAYHMPVAFRITGPLDLAVLRQAFNIVIERHEILRTVFADIGGNQVQQVRSPEEAGFAITVFEPETRLTPVELTRFLQDKWQMLFDLKQGPLLNCFVLKNGSESVLSFNMHHMISDGWSVQLVYEEVTAAYRRLLEGNGVKQPALSFQYRDFSVWQRTNLLAGKHEQALSFWKKQFEETVPVLHLPVDFNRPEVKTYNGATYSLRLTDLAYVQLREMMRISGSSLYTVLMALVNLMLKKYTDQDDIVMGTPVLGRTHHQLADQVGFYANTLPVRTKIDSAISFRAFLEQVRHNLLLVLEYQDLPFETLVNDLQLKRDLSRSPLFDVMVLLQDAPDYSRKAVTPDLFFERLNINPQTAKYDLTFSFGELPEGLLLELEYNTDLFRADTIDRMALHLNSLIAQAAADPDIKIRDLSMITPEEQQLIDALAAPEFLGYDTTATIVSLFGEAVARFGNNIALQTEDRQLTFNDLDRLSSKLATILVRQYQVTPDDPVLLLFERNEWMIIAIFAVLKTGAAYVPVDPDYPAARISYIIEDTGSTILLTDGTSDPDLSLLYPFLNRVDITAADDAVVAETFLVQPRNLAYIIYTSGTTGHPKGVMIEHRNVVRLLFNDGMPYDFNASDRWALLHSYCFDVSVWEIFGALLYGGTLYIIPKDTIRDSIAAYDFLLREKITVLNQTPTAFRSLVQYNRKRFAAQPLDRVRFLVFAGEALMPAILKDWQLHMPACRNINMYGITETTVHVTFKEITGTEIKGNISNVGVPLPTLGCYVLDKELQQVPPGVTGELCVGGAGVARGYWKRPELTAERFVQHPWCAGAYLYRSGDYARILASGDIEYIGRRDDQMKIRGHRIELTEVAAALKEIPGVDDAIVLARKDSGDEFELIAYYTSDAGTEAEALRHITQQELPAYMVPSYFLKVPFFPVNANGKLDRTVLPEPGLKRERTLAPVIARNEIDETLVIIWEEVLEQKNIGIKDDFFSLGGHSLKAIRVISRVQEMYGVKIDLAVLFRDATITHLSDYIRAVRQIGQDALNVPEGEGEEEESII